MAADEVPKQSLKADRAYMVSANSVTSAAIVLDKTPSNKESGSNATAPDNASKVNEHTGNGSDAENELLSKKPSQSEKHPVVVAGLQSALGRMLVHGSRSEDTAEAFLAKVVSFTVAELSSITFGNVLKALGQEMGMAKKDAALAGKSAYAMLITVVNVSVVWSLRDRAKGHSFFNSSIKLFVTSGTVLIAWGWKDLVAQIEARNDGILSELIIAIFLTIVIVGLQCAPWYEAAKAAVAAGGDGDTLATRFKALPGSLGLTLGYAWNLVITHVIGDVQEKMDNEHAQFFVQAGFSLVISLAVQESTKFISKKIAALKREGDPDCPATKKTIGFLTTTTTSIAFLQAWALLDVCNAFFFGICYDCSGSASSCSLQSNLIFSMVVTYIFVQTATTIRFIDDEERATSDALIINSMMLTSGWGWKSFFLAWEIAAVGEVENHWEESGKSAIIFVCVWALCTAIYGWVLDLRRAKEHLRKRDLSHIGQDPEKPQPIPSLPKAKAMDKE